MNFNKWLERIYSQIFFYLFIILKQATKIENKLIYYLYQLSKLVQWTPLSSILWALNIIFLGAKYH
jgi:hypothetical protein